MNSDQEKGVVESFELLNQNTSNKFSPGRLVSKEEAEELRRNEPTYKKIVRVLTKGENLLVTLIVIFAIIGILIGTQSKGASPTTVLVIKFPGEIFMRMLKSMIVPIIFTSIVCGLASIDVTNLKRIGLHALTYFMSTTFIAVVLGISLVLTIKPGSMTDNDVHNDLGSKNQQVSTLDTFLDLIRRNTCLNLKLHPEKYEKNVL